MIDIENAPPRAMPDRLPEIVETTRLRLRPPVLGDAEAIFEAYAQDADVTRYLAWRPHERVETVREFLEETLANIAAGTETYWVIEDRETRALMGAISAMHEQPYRLSLGYVLARAFHGHGFMTEAGRAVVDAAFALPVMRRVWAITDIENMASARVLEKIGMEREGILRRYFVHPNLGDEPRDVIVFARVR